jgi:hypothetical protein
MLVRCVVTLDARHRGVMRGGLESGDLAVARTARRWKVRRLRCVWIVAGDARRQRVVRDRIDLGESGRPRRIVLMTSRTEGPLGRDERLDLVGRIDVRRSRSVTRFARDRLVARLAVHLQDVPVTALADGTTGILDLGCQLVVNGAGPVVSQLSERLRDKVVTSRDQGKNQEGEEQQQATDLLRQARRPVRASPSPFEKGSDPRLEWVVSHASG